jgi:hypothetical protein
MTAWICKNGPHPLFQWRTRLCDGVLPLTWVGPGQCDPANGKIVPASRNFRASPVAMKHFPNPHQPRTRKILWNFTLGVSAPLSLTKINYGLA